MPRFRLTSSKTRRRRSRRAAVIALWMLAPLLIVLTVWQQASVDRMVLALDKEKDARRALDGQVNALRFEASQLSSLGQVEERASRELGLRRPETDQIVDLVFPDREPGTFLALGSLVGDADAAPREEPPAK
jgi:cell division protein FtsL